MLVLLIGVSVWFVVEASKLHLDHTPRWPPRPTPAAPMKLDHVLGRYQAISAASSTSIACSISLRAPSRMTPVRGSGENPDGSGSVVMVSIDMWNIPFSA